MKRTVFPVLVLLLFGAAAQAQPVASRGFIPPLFTLPESHEDLRFTSAAQPEFATPEYPQGQFAAGIEGVAEVTMYVTAEGKVVYAEVSVSSGVQAFDHAALESALRSRFPQGYATLKGMPHDFRLAVPFYFLLANDPEQYWHSRLELARIQSEYETVMKKFEDYVSARTAASSSKVREIQRQLEETVVAAKGVHRLLAEKKERAILRLRQLLDASRGNSAPLADDSDASWRTQVSGGEAASVQAGHSPAGVIKLRPLNGDEADRLAQELELKKTYM